MIDNFYIGAYWKDRPQLLSSIIIPTMQTLIDLADIDEQFADLYELGMSRKQALEHKALLSPHFIEKLYQKRIKKADFDANGYSKIGYSLSLWTGQKDAEASNISFGIGKNSTALTNVCLIQIPSEGLANHRLLHLDKVKAIITILVENWDPEVVVLNSKKISNTLDLLNEVGWVTYRKNLKGKPKLSGHVIHDDNFLGGHLFHLNTASVYDYDLIDELVPITKVI
jgi:hypothetical protein